MKECFVIQPFDGGGEFDKRYNQVFVPAVQASKLKPYRVDQDPEVNIVIQGIESKIKDSTLCLADITKDNPNVWYEIGFATAAGKDVIFVCSEERAKFPFDIQHRNIIKYKKDSPEDFTHLQKNITARINALLNQDKNIEAIVHSPIKTSSNLTTHEMTCLVIIMENINFSEDIVSSWGIRDQMEKHGFTKVATNIALKMLSEKEMVESRESENYSGDPYHGYALTNKGESWLIANQEKLQLKIDDIPF